MGNKILHLAWDGHLGGVQRYLRYVLTASSWENTTHTLCLFNESGVILNDKELHPIEVHTLNILHGWQLSHVCELDTIVQHVAPDVIHCHCDTPAFLLHAARYPNIKKVFHEHGDTIMRRKRSWITSLMWRLLGTRYDAIIANSHYVSSNFIARHPHLEKRVEVLHNPLIEASKPPVQTEQSCKTPKVGVFGRLVWQKGIDRFLIIAKKVLEKCPDTQFYLYGDGPERNALEKQAATLSISENVFFEGFVPNPLDKMASVDCVVVPSRFEPFGLVALEAQSVGVPVVGFTPSGVEEIVINAETGFIVPQDDLTKMAEATLLLLQDSELKKRLGSSGQKRATAKFSMPQHIASLEEVYNNLLS